MDAFDVRSGRRLLVISCTRRKHPLPGGLAAWDRYQGGCFPTLKHIQTTYGFPSDIDIVILSAKYGLVRPCDRIEWYDQKMSPERAKELQPLVEEKVSSLLRQAEYAQSLVLLEEVYMGCLQNVNFPRLTYLDNFSLTSLSLLTSWILCRHTD